MLTTHTIALRNWDWLVPWFRGEVDRTPLRKLGVELTVTAGEAVTDLWQTPGLSGAETSFSRYVRARAAGADAVWATPHFVMQGFRHRCVITRRDAGFSSARDLRGATIGLTGWADSGNTWTRAALADDGLAIADAQWRVGRLTGQHPVTDRLEGFGVPGRIAATDDTPMVDLLASGDLDAVLTPFMPPGFYSPDSRFRPLYADVPAAEIGWMRQTGCVPGHHVLAFSRATGPEVAAAISEALSESARLWRAQREKLAETSLWLAADFWRESQAVPAALLSRGLRHRAPMVRRFVAELCRQRIIDREPALHDLFPHEPQDGTDA